MRAVDATFDDDDEIASFAVTRPKRTESVAFVVAFAAVA